MSQRKHCGQETPTKGRFSGNHAKIYSNESLRCAS